MKTIFEIKTTVKIFILTLILSAGTVAVFAQRGGRGHDREYKENKHFYKENRGRGDRYQPSYRGRDRYYSPGYGQERGYYRKAPWGLHRPYIMPHNRGRLYCYQGRYYEYYPGYGYAIVEAPVGYVFDAVPRGFTRVWVDNAWCYHRGDFYLRPSAHGYISFNRPGLSIGASF